MRLLDSRLSLVLLFAVLLLAGCSQGNKLTADSPEEAYNKGVAAYEAEKYDDAIKLFRLGLSFGRTNDWADETQLALARAYFGNREYILAANEYTRFVEFYRADPRAEAAAFERARSYYLLSPPYRLDQTDTETALSYLRLFTNTYPQSNHSADVSTMIDELLQKLSRKKYEVAEQYEVMGRAEAAALSYLSVMEKYPGTDYVGPALIGAMRSFMDYADRSVRARQVERYRRVIEVYNQFVQLFPNSDRRDDAEGLRERAAERIAELETATASR